MMVRMGLYARYLVAWFTYHLSEDLLVFRSEDFWKNADAGYHDVCKFLGQSSGCAYKTMKHSRRNHKKETNKPMLTITARALQDFYKPHNAQLAELLGRDMGWD